jgi:hypothetical protein
MTEEKANRNRKAKAKERKAKGRDSVMQADGS